MRTRHVVAFSMLAGIALGAVAIQGLHAQTKPPLHFIADSLNVTAAGAGEYLPVSPNDSEEGRAANRRTRIVILPQLDQFFKLLERK